MAKEKLTPLKKKADSVFSLYIRLRDAGRCYTCDHVGDIKRMQAGHYVSRQCLELRYDEMNVHTQCPRCNMYHDGEKITYRERLIAEYGPGPVELLEMRRHCNRKYTAEDYHNLIDYYKNRLKEFE